MLKRSFAVVVLLLSLPLLAQEATSDSFNPHVFSANFGLNMGIVKGHDDAGMGIVGGGKYSFYFSEKVGLFVGLDYIQRNSTFVTTEYEMSAMDIPVGLAFRYRNLFDNEATTFLGVYYAMPQDGTAKAGGQSAKVEGKNHFGLLLQTDQYFPVNPRFDLGFFVAVKFGFGDMITKVGTQESTMKNNTLDVGIGVAARF